MAANKNEKPVNSILENMLDAYFRTDLEGRFLYISPSAPRIYGYDSVEEMMALPVTAVYFRPEDAQRVWHEMETRGVFYDRVGQGRKKNGLPFWVSMTAHFIWDEKGRAVGMEGVIRDITDNKRAEERLQDSEQRLADIISLLPDATFVIDREGRVIAWNRAMEEMTGMAAGEMLGKGDYEYAIPFYGERRPILVDLVLLPDEELFKSYAHIKKEGAVLTGETYVSHLRGGGVYLRATASALYDSKGEISGAIEVIRDITERKRAEEALQKAKEAADAANQAKSVFLANMSHEIRTPMNAILGFSQLTLRDPALTPMQRQHLEIITRSGEHLLDLINDILSLSRIEAGRVALVAEAFRPRQLVTGIAEMFRMKTEAKGLDLRVEVGLDVPEAAEGDEVKIRQVLLNLVGNAVKFTDEGSVGIRVDYREGCAGFEVKDTGPGVPESDRDAIFRPFVQAESGAKAREGTGLGLAISRGFVEKMGGVLEVGSEVGKGSTFTFRIPLPAADIALVPRREERPVIGLAPGQPPLRVLVVDDQDDNRLLLMRMLEGFGAERREARNGEEAVAVWQAWRPQIVFMDIRMPVLDGYEATRRIRALEGQADRAGRAGSAAQPRKTVVIACTASVFEHDRKAIYTAGCDDILPKPVREASVAEKITTHLGVEFLYGQPSPAPTAASPRLSALTTERFAAIPRSTIDLLEQALVRGDEEAALSANDALAEQDGDMAGEIREMVGQFRSGEILDLIEGMHQ